MNNQKVRKNDPPSFRTTEVSDRGRLVGLDRMFESENLKLWVSFTPLSQGKAWREREGKKEKAKK